MLCFTKTSRTVKGKAVCKKKQEKKKVKVTKIKQFEDNDTEPK